MIDQNHRGRHWLLACGVIAAGFLFILAMAGVYLFSSFGKPVPTVEILQPDEPLGVESGQAVVLQARAAARNGVQSVQFLVNDLPVEIRSAGSDQLRTMDASFSWFSSQPGIHKLTVIAYSSTGAASEPEAVLVVVHPRELFPDLSGDAASQGQGQGPGQDGDSTSQDPGGADGQPGEGIDVGLWPMGVEDLVAQVALDDPFPLDLPGQPADSPPEITSFTIDPVRSGSRVRVNYQLNALDDIGLVRVVFYASSLDDPMMPDRMQYVCGGEVHCSHSDSIELERGGWLLSVQAVDTSGQVSEIHTRQVHILNGDDPPAIAEGDDQAFPLDPQDELDQVNNWDEEVNDIGSPRLAEYRCSGQIIVLEIPYTYVSDHGEEIYVGAWAEAGNTMVAAGHVRVTHGSGVARVEMEPIAPDLADTTSTLKLHFMTPEGDYFYTETVMQTLVWPIPQPDLTIEAASQADALVDVSVKNMGCTSVSGFKIQLKPVAGQHFQETVDGIVGPGATKNWTTFIDPNVYANGFEVIVDPDNEIEEINEDNNAFVVNPIQFKSVHIHSIQINHTSDGEWHQDADDGEFYFYLHANEHFTRRPQVDGMRWVLSPGFYEIEGSFMSPVILTPQLQPDGYLFVEVMVREYDEVGSDDTACWIKSTQYADMFDPNSWKHGGEFSMSDGDKCTVYWRVDLE